MTIQTILFDLDGTILDSNELIYASFDHTFKQYNYSFTREEILNFNGPPLLESFSKIDPDRAEMMIETYREHNHAKHNEYVKLFPNVIETIETLKNNHFKIGIVTAKMRTSVDLGLALTGLDRFFETIITIDDVVHPKPHPESVIKAMAELKGDIDSTLMIGDNYHDILAGQNAGVRTAGVAWSSKGKEFLASYQPTYMLNDMKDLLGIVGV
jgi:pyrophosphatase PpaX